MLRFGWPGRPRAGVAAADLAWRPAPPIAAARRADRAVRLSRSLRLVTDPLDFLFSLERLGMKFGLENMRDALRRARSSRTRFASVIVAGTNGKGSVTAMSRRGAPRRRAPRSARYTSPHLERLDERFVIDEREVETGRRCATPRGAIQRRRRRGWSPQATLTRPADLLRVHHGDRLRAVPRGAASTSRCSRSASAAVSTPPTSSRRSPPRSRRSISITRRSSATRWRRSRSRRPGIIKPGIPVVCGPLPAEARRGRSPRTCADARRAR